MIKHNYIQNAYKNTHPLFNNKYTNIAKNTCPHTHTDINVQICIHTNIKFVLGYKQIKTHVQFSHFTHSRHTETNKHTLIKIKK